MSRRTQILVVDSDPAAMKYFSAALRSEGYDVSEAATGDHGLQLAGETWPHLAVVASRLPDGAGVDFCRQLKADDAPARTFVMLISEADATPAPNAHGWNGEIDDYLVKPVKLEELLARTRTLLRLRETEADLRASEQRYRDLVAERVFAEEAVRESEERKNAVMEAALEGIITFDHEGKIIEFNATAERMVGSNRRNVIGRALAEVLISSSLRPWFERGRQQGFVANEGPVLGGRIEMAALRADGTEFAAEMTIARIKLAGPPMFTVFLHDVTGRKRAKEQLRLLADAVESAQEMISITDEQNRFKFANRAFLEAYGYREEEILGRTPEFLHSLNNPEGLCKQIFQQTLAGAWRGEVQNCRKDGSEFPISLSTSRIKDPEGRILGLVGVARDIAELRRAERETAAFSLLGHRLSAATTAEQAARIIFEIASHLLKWDAGYVHLYSNDDDKIIPILTMDTVAGDRTEVPVDSFTLDPSPLMRSVMKEGARLINRDENSSPAIGLVPFGNKNRHSTAMMYVPIRFAGAVLGLLSIQSYTPRAYSKSDLAFLQALADHCGDALQRIKATEALRETEAKYRIIFEDATEGIFQTTPAGRYLSANPALARMFGYASPAELIANVHDLAWQTYVDPQRREELKRLLESKDHVQGFEAERFGKDGRRFWISINGHAVRDASGRVLYYEGTNQDITPRKFAEAVLRESEEKFRTFFEAAPIGIALHDRDGRYVQANKSYQLMLGYTEAELRENGVRRLTFADDVPEAQRLFGELRDGKRNHYSREKRYWARNGALVWAQSSASAVRDAEGRLRYIISMVEDISERKWVENLLQIRRDFGVFLSSTNDLQAAVERLLQIALQSEGIDSGAVYLVDEKMGELNLAGQQGLSVQFARRAAHFSGSLAKKEAVNRDQTEPHWNLHPMAGLVEELKGESLTALEVIPIQHAASVVAVLSVGSHKNQEIPARSCQLIEAIASQTGGAIARIRAEQSLRTNRQLLEKTLHSLRSAVFIIDADTAMIQECNPAASHLFGYNRDEMIGRTTEFLYVDAQRSLKLTDPPSVPARAREVLREVELKMRKKNGAPFPCENSLMPIKDEAGRTVSWVCVVRDLTDIKRAEEELRQLPRRIIEAQEAERLRVARELHDGVNQVIASAKMRLRKVEDGSPALGPAARELLARCDHLLVQALEENRRIAHNLRPTDLDTLGLAAACHNFCRELRSRVNLDLKCSVARFVGRLTPALELNLFRIAQEAINNIEKHARAKRARLRIAFGGDSIVLRIQDDGRGFDPRKKAAKGRGRGIGLTNIQERASALGGTCEVKSAPDEGTIITVRVPLKRAE